MTDEGPKRSRRWAWGVLAILGLTGLTIWMAGRIDPSTRSAFASCRNHADFVAAAISGHVDRHGWLPHVAALPGEELFCKIDFEGAPQNCHAGAPGQNHGGWQMVNASPATWREILKAGGTQRVPVLWCGKPHAPGASSNYTDGPVRIVLVLDPSSPTTLATLEAAIAGKKGQAGLLFSAPNIVYGMPDRELARGLGIINSVLERQGDRQIPIDVVGRLDYASLSGPNQTASPPRR